MTFLMLITIAPAIAAPSVKVQHLQVSNIIPTAQTSYDSITLADKVIRKYSTQYGNNFSTGLILSSTRVLSEENTQVAMTVVNKSNGFFTSAMIVSDKLNQLISYFNSPAKNSVTEQVEPVVESEVIKKKCGKKNNYS